MVFLSSDRVHGEAVGFSRGYFCNSVEYIPCVASWLQLESDSDAHVLIPAKSASRASEFLRVVVGRFGKVWRDSVSENGGALRVLIRARIGAFTLWQQCFSVGGWVGTHDDVRVFLFSRNSPAPHNLA